MKAIIRKVVETKVKNGEKLVAIIANKVHKRLLVKAFFSKEDLQQDIIDFLEGED